MAGRTASLDFKSTGADTATGNVVKLADALTKQRAEAERLATTHAKTRKETDSLSVTQRAAAEETARFAGALGPLGVGLAHVALEAPRAAAGLLQYAAAGERASAMSRVLNTTALAGGAVFATAAVGLAAYVRHLVEMGDAYASLQAKANIYTKGPVGAAQFTDSVFKTARDSRTSVENVARLSARLEPEVSDSGRRPQDAVRLAGIVSKALAIQGASPQEQSYGSVDLIHAIGQGTVDTRALRGLQREAPQLLRYIAQNLDNGKGGFGVPTGDLQKLAKAKSLTSDKVLDSLFRAQPQIEADLSKAPKLASQEYQILADSVMHTVGEMGQLTGAQPALVNFLSSLADKSDAFRQSLERDPQAIANVRAGLNFIGQTVDGIGSLGAEAFKHLDLVVKAAEVIISLKAGEAIASWFSTAARGAAATARNLQEFASQARFNAGAKVDPAGAAAAREVRAASVAADARAAQSAERAAIAKAKYASAAQLAEGKIAEAARVRAAAVDAADEAQRVADLGAAEATRDRAAADRLAGEAAEIRARLEADAAARTAEAAASRNAAGAASSLSSSGVGSAGAYFAKQAQGDAVNAMRLTEPERAAQLEQLAQVEAAQARYAATVTASEMRVAQAAEFTGSAQAQAATLAAEAEARETEAATANAAASDLRAKAARSAATADTAQAAAAGVAERAMAAEAAVAGEATGAMVAQNVALGVLKGAYNLLGGGIGIATLAIGGLIYAIWQEEQAFRQQAEALKASVVVSGQMKAVTDQLTTATWSQVPALQAQARALRDVAHAKLEGVAPGGGQNLRQKLAADQAALKQTTDLMRSGAAGDAGASLAAQAALQERQVKADQAAVASGVRDVGAQNLQVQRGDAIGLTRTIQHLNDLLERGRNERGDPLTGGARAALQAQLRGANATAKQGYDRSTGEVRDLYAEAIAEGIPPEKVKSSIDDAKKPKARGDVDSALKKALEEIEQQQAMGQDLLAKIAGMDHFGAVDGKVRDLTTGKAFQARSEDEAKAAQRYQDQLAAINKATPAEVAKYGGGRSKDDLRAASEQAFKMALADSQASKQDEALKEGLQRLGLASEEQSNTVKKLDQLLSRNPEAAAKLTPDKRAELEASAQADDDKSLQDKLQKLGLAADIPTTKVGELNKVVDDNAAAWARLSPYQRAQMKTWAEMADRLDATKKGLSSVKPIFDEQYRLASDRAEPAKVEGFGLDAGGQAAAERERLQSIVAQAQAATEAKVRSDQAKADQDEPWMSTANAQKAADEIAAIRIASAAKVAEEEAKIDRDAQTATLQRQQQAASTINDTIRDMVLGRTNFQNIGKKITDDLLQAMYDNLVGNPLKLMIQQALGNLFAPGQSGTTGSLLSLVGAMFGIGGVGPMASPTAVNSFSSDIVSQAPNGLIDLSSFVPSLTGAKTGGWIGGLMGFAGGGAIAWRDSSGRLHGSGTGTSDSLLALVAGGGAVKVSKHEMVMNAAATSAYGGQLDAINRSAMRGYANGGPISPSGMSGGAGGGVTVNDYRTNAPPVQTRTGADGGQVIDIRDTLQRGIRANPEAVRDAAFSAPPKVTRRGG